MYMGNLYTVISPLISRSVRIRSSISIYTTKHIPIDDDAERLCGVHLSIVGVVAADCVIKPLMPRDVPIAARESHAAHALSRFSLLGFLLLLLLFSDE